MARRVTRSLLVAVCFLPFTGGRAQAPPSDVRPTGTTRCAGELITQIVVRSHPPSAQGAAARFYEQASEMTTVHLATTRPAVIRAWLLLSAGEPCNERARAESERLLRAQPFIASAAIRVQPDGAGRARLLVDVVDELPLIVSGSISRGTLSSIVLGTENLAGRGLLVSAGLSRGFAYRAGFGARAVWHGAFGRPQYVSIEAERLQHGDKLAFAYAEPLLTDIQRRAFHVSAGGESDFNYLRRNRGEEVALFTRRAFWDAGLVRRIGSMREGRTAGALGVVLMGEDIRIGGGVVVVSDSGLVPAPDSALVARYPDYGVARVALLSGVRRMRYLTVDGFDALQAQQDVGIGVQVGMLAGPSFWASRGEADLFVSGDLYAGVGGPRSFLAAQLLAEARANHASGRWSGAVSSTRLSWYAKAGDQWTTMASVEGAALKKLSFPSQLSFRDGEGGVRGYADAAASGGGRAVMRLEGRRDLPQVTPRAAIAVALFADAGKLWARDAPYGVTTPVRGSLGVSLLGAYPAAGKRTYRLDFAFPLNPEHGGATFEVRLRSSDRTRGVWREPRDVARTRTGALPATLLKW